jgi:hypothetical protein
MALSTLSLGMFAAFAFCITARSFALLSGSGPPSFTAITISFPIRVKALGHCCPTLHFSSLSKFKRSSHFGDFVRKTKVVKLPVL